DNIANQQFHLPIVDPRKTEMPELGQFPTDKVIAKAADLVNVVEKESKRLSDDAMSMNRHEPLVRNALPDGNGVALSQFKEKYHQALKSLMGQLNATTPVTPMDVQEEQTKLEAEYRKQIINGPQGSNDAEVMAQFAEIAPTIPNRLKLERSQKYSM